MNTGSYAHRILATLDGFLDSSVELTLYGRAAIYLGFPSAPEEVAYSRDVDAVLWSGQAEELADRTNFWEALQSTNDSLVGDRLYVSHLFVEDQVILRRQWRAARVAISGEWKQLRLFRLGDLDLLLSKLMRDDPQDLCDALTIANAAPLTREEIQQALIEAVVPPIPEIVEQFAVCQAKLLARFASQHPNLN